LGTYRKLHQAMRSGLVQACHDLSEGGLAVALAEMALGGRLGIDADVPAQGLDPWTALYAESNGRLVVEVAQADRAAFEQAVAGAPLTHLGTVTAAPYFKVAVDGQGLIDLDIDLLVAAWKQQLVGVSA
jgi:phosphoribosylformylglycinamidine synthase